MKTFLVTYAFGHEHYFEADKMEKVFKLAKNLLKKSNITTYEEIVKVELETDEAILSHREFMKKVISNNWHGG